jgi:hypothetical protein
VRLCCKSSKDGISEMKALQFFAGVSWDDLLNKRIAMPHIPQLLGNTDVSSFEDSFTRER